MLVLLAKLTSPERVGEFALALAVTGPVFMLTNLQLRTVQATDARGEFEFPDYLALRLLSTFAGLVVIAVIALAGRYEPSVTCVVLAMGLAKAVESISDLFYGFFQHVERLDIMATSMVLKGGLSVAALWAGLRLFGHLAVAVLMLAVAWALSLALYDVRKGRHASRAAASRSWSLRPRWRGPILFRLLVLSFPLGLVTGLISLTSNIPRYFLERSHGARELGLFAAVAYIAVAGGTIVNAIGQAISPRLSKYYAGGHRAQFGRLVIGALVAAALVGGAGIAVASLAGAPLLAVLYRSEYSAGSEVLVWMMGAAALSYAGSMLGYSITAARRFNVQAPLYLVAAIVTTSACVLLVPARAGIGAAQSVALAAFVTTAGALLILRNAWRLLPTEVESS